MKGKRWPYYYGIQPSGSYPDQPFIKELHYNGAAGDIARGSLKQVPLPEIAPPRPVVVDVPTPVVVPTPPTPPPPPPVVNTPPVTPLPNLPPTTCGANCLR